MIIIVHIHIISDYHHENCDAFVQSRLPYLHLIFSARWKKRLWRRFPRTRRAGRFQGGQWSAFQWNICGQNVLERSALRQTASFVQQRRWYRHNQELIISKQFEIATIAFRFVVTTNKSWSKTSRRRTVASNLRRIVGWRPSLCQGWFSPLRFLIMIFLVDILIYPDHR